ncbi:MAG: LicD family protein [Clostridium sp.]|nr:LicD family protein [Clostridium sp.]
MDGVETKSITKYLYENVRDLIQSGRLNNKYIVIFGANKPALAVIEYLDQEGITIDAIVDNNKQKRDMIELGKMSLINGKYHLESPQYVLGEYRQNAIILIASQCYHDMCTQIEDLGYDAQEHTIQLLTFPELPKEKLPGVRYISQSEMKEIELQLLIHFRNECDRMGLRYYLCGGTLLGAIRHKGYIPWDDDIDVFMPVPDYLKFIEQFKENDEYKLLNIDNCTTSYMFTRLINKHTVLEEIHYPLQSKTGINIDIFPISGFPSGNTQEVEDFTEEILKLRNDWDDFWFNYGFGDKEENQYEQLKMRIKDIMTRYDFDQSEVVGYIVTGKLDRELLSRNNFDDYLIGDFENEQFKMPKGYDAYLSNMYGDYMRLPAKEQQESKHEFNAWWE